MSESVPNGRSANSIPGGRYSRVRGKFGLDSDGAAPIAVMTFMTSARCSISSIAMPVSGCPPSGDRVSLLSGQAIIRCWS